MLDRALGEEDLSGASVLDLCTGSGLLAIAAARAGAAATAVDVSRRAVLTVRLNARLNGVRVTAVRGRLFEPLGSARFDVIVSNPPYVPSPQEELPRRGPSRAWAAGRDGRAVLDEICDHAARHLRPGGVLLLTHSSLIGEDITVDRLAAAGLGEIQVVARQPGPLGPLMRAQQRQGTVPSGIVEEEVVIVRATGQPRRVVQETPPST